MDQQNVLADNNKLMVGNLNISTWSPARYLTEEPVQPLHGHPGVGSERVEHVADVLPIEVSTKFRNLQLQFTISLFKAFSEYCESFAKFC